MKGSRDWLMGDDDTAERALGGAKVDYKPKNGIDRNVYSTISTGTPQNRNAFNMNHIL